MNKQIKILVFMLALALFLAAQPALAQPTRTTGTVVSSTPNTMVVRTEQGRHVLFVFEDSSARPSDLPTGARVRVESRPDAEGIHVASSVTVTGQGPAGQRRPGGAPEDPVPTEVRRLENQIERQFRRFRGGVRVGSGLDPEVFSVGVHAKLGPFFRRDVWFRPNVEFAFGEVTTLGAINLEGVYRLPITERQSKWSAYIGMGPGFNFIDEDFERSRVNGDRDIDFSDFDFDPSLNILVGLESRSGMFFEVKTAVFARPTIRLLIGYSF